MAPHWAPYMLKIKVNYWGDILLSQAVCSLLNMTDLRSSGPHTVQIPPRFFSVLPGMDLPMKAGTGWDIAVEAVDELPQ